MALISIYYLIIYLVPSEAPQNLSATVISSTSILVQWVQPPPSTHQGQLTIYRVTYSGELLDTTIHSVDISASNTAVNLINLQENTRYQISVSAFTYAGGGPSISISEITLEDGMIQYV